MYPSSQSLTFGIFVKNQVEALRSQGFDVEVIAVTNPRQGGKQALKKYGLWFFKVGYNMLFKGKKYDVVHAHYVFPTGIFLMLYKKLFGTRTVVTVHGGDIDKMAKKNGMTRYFTKKILTCVDHVIAVGQQLSFEIHDVFQVPYSKQSVINMGVNREVFCPLDKEELREKHSIDKKAKVILYVGNFIREKGLMQLLQAYQIVKEKMEDAQLYMIGAVKDESFYDELLREIKEKNVKDVYMFPPKPQSEVAEWMNIADVFVLPSHMEGFGLVALEAMACGTPVIGTNVGGLKYLLGDGAGMIVEPKQIKPLAEAIEKVLTDDELAQQIREQGMRRAEENDARKMLNRVVDVYFPTGG